MKLGLDYTIKRSDAVIKKTAIAEAKAVKAETKGFEPLIQFPVYTLSRRAPSTTRTRLQ